MRIALLSPLPPRQSGIADYAAAFMHHLELAGAVVETPLAQATHGSLAALMEAVDWSRYEVVHAELGGGGTLEFAALQWLMRHRPRMRLTATVHDPERLVWRQQDYPAGLGAIAKLSPWLDKALTLLFDPLTLRAERQLAQHMERLITLTQTGAECLQQRMRVPQAAVCVIPHGNQHIAAQPAPELPPLRLLYFGFIYRGKGIEDLLQALAAVLARRPDLKSEVLLTLAGGTAPAMTFQAGGSYVDELRELSKTLGLEANLKWDLDVPSEQIVPLIQAHHALVLPYQESRKLALLGQIRGTSGALSWGTACGRGVLASDARAFAEELSYGNGRVYKQGCVASLSQQLEQLIQHSETSLEWIAAAQQLAQERAWPLVAKRFMQVFRGA